MLKKLWSPTGLLLHDIEFRKGLNLISGEYGEAKSTTGRNSDGSNGIGKSSIVRLIDYLLLSSSAERMFKDPKYDFLRQEEHQICLGAAGPGGEILIRRHFAQKDCVYLSGISEADDFYTIEEAKRILESFFFPMNDKRSYSKNSYRDLMRFFVKDDLTGGKRADPIAFSAYSGAKKIDSLLLNLYLLGFPGADAVNLMSVLDQKKHLEKNKKLWMETLQKNTGVPIAQLRSEVMEKEKNLAILKQSLDELRLTESFKSISESIAHFDEQISQLRNKEQQINRQLKKLEKFTSNTSTEIDVADTMQQYKMVTASLASAIYKSLDEVLQFRQSIANERLNFYGDRFNELSDNRRELLKKIQEQDGQRSALLQTVNDGLDKSLSEAWGQYALQQAELEATRIKLKDINDATNHIFDLDFKISELKRNILHEMDDYDAMITDIQQIFKEIVAAAFHHVNYNTDGAYLSIDREPQNRNMALPVSIKTVFPQKDAWAHTKLEMIIYDLTVLLHAVRRGIKQPDFLIHDGVFHGIEIRKKINLLNFIHEQSQYDDFQYIVPFNADEITPTENEKQHGIDYNFNWSECVIISLKDQKDKMLFKRRFD